MNKIQESKLARFIQRKNPFDTITFTSDSMHPAKVRITYDIERNLYLYSVDNPGYHPTNPLEGDPDYLREWLEHAYRLRQTVTYHFDDEEGTDQ